MLQADGAVEYYEDPSEALSVGAEGRVELRYAYDPDLMPSEAPTSDGMWRYRDLLPVEEAEILYPLAIGGTPLVAQPRLREVTNMPRLWLKDETRTPTGSNNDRATSLFFEHTIRNGVMDVSCAL